MAVMPQGVEHRMDRVAASSVLRVAMAVMPQGVEHNTSAKLKALAAW